LAPASGLTTLLKRPIRNRETSPVDIDIETPTQRAFVDETAVPETHSQIGEPRMNTTEHGCLPVPPDGDLPTLHIRCGSDIRETLRQAGFAGDFLEYSDPICQGPVPDTSDLLQRRARYLAQSCGSIMGFTEAQSLAGLEAAERRLNEAHTYPRVVLWFEHDSYDQLLLARCLARFAEGPLPAHLELICIDRHPSVKRFLGLGQLGPPALASLWPYRTVVTPAQLELGRLVWAALRRADPSDLAAIAATGTPALPLAAPALRRHLQELPGARDGLSMTERLALRILAGEPTRIGRIFAACVQGAEPLPFLGDIGFLGAVEQMAVARPAVLTIEAGEKPFPRLATITETGRQVLAGQVDYLSLGPPERWVGGVVADGQWRWDDSTGGILRVP
jgi:hypothetical protein